jgi:hypothetical protein
MPGDQDAGGGIVLGLGEQIGGDVVRIGRLVGQHHHLAGPGEAIDGDLAEDVFLGEGDEDVSRADDHVHGGDLIDAERERRHRLGTADAVDFADAQLVAGGQQIGIVSTGLGGRHDDGDFKDAGRLRGTDRHQQRGRIGRRPAGNADAHALQGPIAKAQLMQIARAQDGVGVHQAKLEAEDVLTYAAQGLQKRRVGLFMSTGQFRVADSDIFRLEPDLIELLGVMEYGLEAAGAHVAADALDSARRRHGFAEDSFRELFSARRHHVGVPAQLVAQGDQLLGCVGSRVVNSANVQSRHPWVHPDVFRGWANGLRGPRRRGTRMNYMEGEDGLQPGGVTLVK